MTNKINFWQECKDFVHENVLASVTHFVDYIRKQDDFFDGNQDCPVVLDDLECIEWEDKDKDYDVDWCEVYMVSGWLADELYKRGEIVARYNYLPALWFRQGCGQAVALDSVMQDIIKYLLVQRGQCTEEEAEKLRVYD